MRNCQDFSGIFWTFSQNNYCTKRPNVWSEHPASRRGDTNGVKNRPGAGAKAAPPWSMYRTPMILTSDAETLPFQESAVPCLGMAKGEGIRVLTQGCRSADGLGLVRAHLPGWEVRHPKRIKEPLGVG